MRKRNLSEFMCIEMLYDYKSEKLDALRAQAVEEGLESSPKVREELKKLSQGISYCDKLKNISVSEPLIELIFEHPKPHEKVFSKIKWQHFPQPVRWALEAVLVAVAIALFVTQVPDLFKSERTESDSMLVKKFDIQPPVEEVPSDIPQVSKPGYVAPEEVPMDVAAPTKVAATPEKIATPTPTAIVAPKVVVPPTVAVPAVTAPVATAPIVATAQPEPAKAAPKKGNAYVYRMTMYVDNVDQVTPEIVALIVGLGGEKAGEVELGWRRKGGSYFHFSVPQNNNASLQEGLKKYAQFNVVKSGHPRVMPEGTERYILWVEKKAGPEDSAQEPTDGSQETTPNDAPASEENSTQGTSEENNEAN